ncbi:SDR family NAD(P)-dependent oxidoreductase [Sediminitomix flava]|uniref:Short-subunit dehydrogenase n=1 Tax=Sediminitomix flava TaxID=379075 RepID=A0A315ZBU6_SEDFL|nr:SDR family NAD(P)-dependent oxidoreductase [Sediminitomix flava]PWJ43045.1 short-subunit dehydrogenase [Sediminitomix flava]
MKKTIFITGSTDGIGKLTAIKLAKEGHEVYLHGRNPQKLEAVISEIKDLTNNESIDGFTADLSDLDTVKKLADEVSSKLTKLDVLINNAGVYKSPKPTNKDGLDMRFVVNYLAPYLLTTSLLPIIRKGETPRIVNLSSAAQSPVSLNVLEGKSSKSEGETYAQSKLALTMWSFDMAKKEKDIIIIPVNPGSLLNTNMVKEAYGQFWSSADKGADILHDLAVGEKHSSMSGKYFDNDRGIYGTAHPDAYDEAKNKALLEVTDSLLGM